MIVVVGARNQLRAAGRAAREQQHGHVRRIRFRERRRCGRRAEQLAERNLTGLGVRLTDDEDLAHARFAFAQLAGQRAVIEAAEPVRDHVADRAGDRGERAEFGHPVRRGYQYRNDAEPERGEAELDELRNVGQLHQDSVARAQSARGQSGGEPVYGVVELCVGQPGRARDQGGSGR